MQLQREKQYVHIQYANSRKHIMSISVNMTGKTTVGYTHTTSHDPPYSPRDAKSSVRVVRALGLPMGWVGLGRDLSVFSGLGLVGSSN